jgi:Uma2 family endonuclease
MIAMLSEANRHDDRILMTGIDWSGFEAFLALRGERSRPLLAYLDGVMEQMSPSHEHEEISWYLDQVVVHYCLTMDIPITGYGSWLIKDAVTQAGLEPDECYVFGFDPRSKQRPDLAVEVIWTSGSIDKLEIYRRLGVPEVWFWEENRLSVFVLGEHDYVQQPRSSCLPDLDFDLVYRLVRVTPLNELVRQLRAALSAPAAR